MLQRLVMGESEAVRESRSPSLLIRRDKELGARMPPVLLVHGTSDKIVPQVGLGVGLGYLGVHS